MNANYHSVIRALRRSDVLATKFIDYIVAHGRPYRGQRLPASVDLWPTGSCVEASEALARMHGWQQVQGWCVGPRSLVRDGRPFYHHFVTDDGERAIDASVPEPELCEYWGVPVAPDGQFDEQVIGRPRKPLIPPDLRPGYLAGGLMPPFRFM